MPAACGRAWKRAGLDAGVVTVAPGEGSKSYAGYAQVCDGLLALKVERGDLVVALGGGVVGDLAGFAAATLRRGVRFVQVPTSLLAQVDSSVGGKTGINAPLGKNLIGAFHQPRLVLADTAALDTLSEREMRAGYAEVAKYGLIADSGFFDWCEAQLARDLRRRPGARGGGGGLLPGQGRGRDPRRAGGRRAGPPEPRPHLRPCPGTPDGLRFGPAGPRRGRGDRLALAFRFSARLGLCAGQDAGRVANHLALAGLPTRLQAVPGGCGEAEAILDAMAQDKKVRDGALTFILARGIGQSFIAPGVDRAEVTAFLRDELASGTAA